MINRIKKLFNNQKDVQIEENIFEKIDNLFSMLDSNIITIIFGNDFIIHKNLIVECISEIRTRMKEDTGFIFPAIHIKNNDYFQENEIKVFVRDKEVFQKFAIPNENEIKKDLENIIDILFQDHLEEIFSFEITEKYLNFAQEKMAWTIWNVTNYYTISEIRDVLVYLLKSHKSIRDINYIFEKFAYYSSDYNLAYKQNPEKIAQKMVLEL